ncbi:Haloacid dehalogenase-like hydrolase, partial [Pseudoloma neurophilia]
MIEYCRPIYISMTEENQKKYKQMIKPLDLTNQLLVFDIDSTLYPETSNKESFVINVFACYVSRETNKSIEQVLKIFNEEKSDPYETFPFKKLGVDSHSYKRALKEINYNKLYKEDKKLRAALYALPYRKICFTKNTVYAARQTLLALGISECFEAVVCVKQNLYWTKLQKPFPESFRFVENLFSIEDNAQRQNIVFIDNSLDNIKAACFA